MGTTRMPNKEHAESAAQSTSEQEVTSQERDHHPTRVELTLISQSESFQPERKTDAPDKPTLKWTKPTIFALGLVVAHQKKACKDGHIQTDWKAVLPVMNDIFPREFEGFNDVHPDGLANAAKLRSQYSDHDRNRENKWRLLQPEKYTPQEIQEMTRMRFIVFETEHRLGQQPESLVLAPGTNAVKWVSFTVKPKPEKTAKKPVVRKRKREPTSEPEAEEPGNKEDQDSGEKEDENEQADDNDNTREGLDEVGDGDHNEEQENSEGQAGGDHNYEEERSKDKHAGDEESSSGSHGPTASYHDSDDDCIIVATHRLRQVVVIEDEDAGRASNEGSFTDAADEIRADRKKTAQCAHSTTRQTHPQRKKSRLSEVHNPCEDDEDDQNDEHPALSTFFRDTYKAGTYGDDVRGLHNVLFDQPTRLEYTANDLAKTRDQFLRTMNDLDLLPPFTSHKTGALDNAIIHSKAAALAGNQDGLRIMPEKQRELLHRHRQNEMKALRYSEDKSLRLSGLAPSAHPPNPPRVYYGDGHTEHLPQPVVYSYSVLRRTIIIAFQARRWDDVWAAIKHVSGFFGDEWNIITDLIDNIVATTGKSRADVTEAVNIATHRQSISSLKLAKLLALPIKIDKNEDAEPDGTLDNIVQQLNNQPKLQMIHTNHVDFTTEPPTYTFRKNTSGSGNNFRFVHSSNTLLEQTGEVRRVLLNYDTTGQGKEIDVMLCDKPLCSECEPHEDMYPYNFDYAEQRKKLPLVHHKDVAMFEDEKLYFVAMQQGPVLNDAAIVKRDIHEVMFGNGRASKVIICDKALCGACKPKDMSCIANLVLPWRR